MDFKKPVTGCQESGVTGTYARVVRGMYEDRKTVIRHVEGSTDGFKVRVGLYQGLALCVFSFAMVMDS